MFIASNLLHALAGVIGMALTLYTWIIIARAVISWVNPDPYNPIVRFLYSVTEPVLYRVRRTVPAMAGGIDFSPIIVLLALFFLQSFLVQSLRDLAVAIR
ncbi:MAG: YggT family protein [Candidatus Binatia bacterium]